MFDKVKEFITKTVDSGEFVVADFIALVQELVAAIFGFIKKEEEIA